MAQLKAQVDKLLTNVSDGYIPAGYISEMLLTPLSVVQKTGLLGKYGDQHLRIENDLMAGRGKAPRVEAITRSTTTYMVESHGLEGLVTPDDKINVEDPFDAEKDETIGLTTMIWLSKESNLAAAVNSTAVITQNVTLAGTDQLSDYTNSDPIDEFRIARETIFASVGIPPDTATMSWEVFNTLAYHPGILRALGFADVRSGQLSESELTKAMGVKRLLIGMAQQNTAVEGQTDVRASVWGKHILFSVTPRSAAKYQTSLGYYLTLKSQKPREVFKEKVINPPQTTSIIVRDSYDMLLSNTDAAFLIEDAIA